MAFLKADASFDNEATSITERTLPGVCDRKSLKDIQFCTPPTLENLALDQRFRDKSLSHKKSENIWENSPSDYFSEDSIKSLQFHCKKSKILHPHHHQTAFTELGIPFPEKTGSEYWRILQV